MQALVTSNKPLRLVATKLLSYLSPRAYVGTTSPMSLSELPDPALPAIGMELAKAFEWTPLYFKEINIIGSNVFGIECFEGRRQHSMLWYFDFVLNLGLDVTAIITHQFSLDSWREAFMTCYNQGKSGAVKVLFDHF